MQGENQRRLLVAIFVNSPELFTADRTRSLGEHLRKFQTNPTIDLRGDVMRKSLHMDRRMDGHLMAHH